MFFIGSFVHATNQEETLEDGRRHGEFIMIVESENPFSAIQKFKDRLVNYRTSSEFFQGDCSIFLTQLLEFDRFPAQEAMMLNFKSVVGDPLLPFISCTVPSDLSDSCRIFDWKSSAPEVDGQKEKLFLQFRAGSSRLLNEPDPSYLLSPET